MDDQEQPTWFDKIFLFAIVAGIVILMMVMAHKAHARDVDGTYAKQNPELHEWFENLRSDEGYCCAEADGIAVSDGDWGTDGAGGHYWVVVPSDLNAPRSSDPKRVEVPSEALVKQANKVGKAMVWPMHREGGVAIRCFMPGTLS